MTPSPSLSGSIGSSGPCSLMLSPSAGEPGFSQSSAKQGDEDLADCIFRQVLLHFNSVQDSLEFMQRFQQWCYEYDPDDDQVNEQWINTLLDVGFSQSFSWTVLHWGLVLCQDP